MPADQTTDTTEQAETEQTETEQTETEQETTDSAEEGTEQDQQSETFPAEYVRQLRDEAKTNRTRAKESGDRADALARRLHTALVAATGRLQDPDDLPYDDAHLDDPDALTAAVDELLERKPHLGSRKPAGDVGQGETGGSGSVDLAGILRSRA